MVFVCVIQQIASQPLNTVRYSAEYEYYTYNLEIYIYTNEIYIFFRLIHRLFYYKKGHNLITLGQVHKPYLIKKKMYIRAYI